jgi:hypothetical protein
MRQVHCYKEMFIKTKKLETQTTSGKWTSREQDDIDKEHNNANPNKQRGKWTW